MKNMKSYLLVFVVFVTTLTVTAQVAINKDGSNPNPNSILHVKGSGVNALYVDYDDGYIGVNNIYPHYRLHLLETVTDTKNYGSVFEITGGSTNTEVYAGVYSYINGTGGTNRAYEGLSYGINTSSFNIGVSGFSRNAKYNYGIQGMATEANTINQGNNIGAITEAGNCDYMNIGTYAIAHDAGNWNMGIYALANESNSGINYGIYSNASNSGTGDYWSGYFDGKLNVNGSIYQNDTVVLHAKNVEPIINASEKVMTFKPVSYVNNTNETSYTFDANDLKKTSPELVKDVVNPPNPNDKNAKVTTTTSINITALLPILTKALQELNDRVETLEKENSALKEEINKLK